MFIWSPLGKCNSAPDSYTIYSTSVCVESRINSKHLYYESFIDLYTWNIMHIKILLEIRSIYNNIPSGYKAIYMLLKSYSCQLILQNEQLLKSPTIFLEQHRLVEILVLSWFWVVEKLGTRHESSNGSRVRSRWWN